MLRNTTSKLMSSLRNLVPSRLKQTEQLVVSEFKKPTTILLEVDDEILSDSFKRRVETKYPLFGGVILGLLANFPAATALANYACSSISDSDAVNAGVCKVLDLNCEAGSFTKDGIELTKFGYTLTQSSGPHTTDGTAMWNCLDDMNKWCTKILIPLFNASSDISKTILTSAQGPTVNGSYVSGIIANAPVDTAQLFSGLFSAQASNCDNIVEKAKVALGFIALIGLIAIPVGIWMKCTGKCDDKKESTPEPEQKQDDTFTFSDPESGSALTSSSAPAEIKTSPPPASDAAPTVSVVVDSMKSEQSVSAPVALSEAKATTVTQATVPAETPAWQAPAAAVVPEHWEPPVLTSSGIESITMSSLMSQSASAMSVGTVAKSQPELANQEPPPPPFGPEDEAVDAEIMAAAAAQRSAVRYG